MDNQLEPSGSNFGPRMRMSTRSKAANGSMRKAKSRFRFRSKRMNKIERDMKKREAYMPPNKRNRSDTNGISVANDAHMHGRKETNASDKKDQDGNIISTLAKRAPTTNSRRRHSSNVLPVNNTSIPLVNRASKSKQSLSHISKNVRDSPSSRLGNVLIPLMDLELSNPSRVKDVLPSTNLENPTPLLSMDGSTARLGHQKQSQITKIRKVHNLNIGRGPHPICLKVMKELAHTTKNIDASNNESDTSVLKSNGPSGRTHGQNINVINSTNEILKPLNCDIALKGSNISLTSEHLVPNKYDSNEYMSTQDKVMNVKEIEREAHICQGHAIYEDNHKKDEIKKSNGAPNSSMLNFDELIEDPMMKLEKISSILDELTEEPATKLEKISSIVLGKDLSCGQKESCNEDKNCAIASSKDIIQRKLELNKKDQSVRYVGKISGVNSKRKLETLREETFDACDGGDSSRVVQWDNMPCVKRRRTPSNEEDQDEAGEYNTNLMGVNGTIGLTTDIVISTNCTKKQCDCCSKPIDKSTWSEIFKIDGKEYISLVGHLSTKSCEKVWSLSKLLPPMVRVERVSRSDVWTKIWKTSKPTSDNIGLYFLPCNMRHDEELDQLVNEVKENDLVLRAIVNEAEMLIFPSVLLPERYQTFQAKHYLWALFKPREDKGVYSQNN